MRLEFGELERFAREASQLGAPPLIIAPNHPSLLDAIFIMAYVPNVTCVIKASLRRNPFLSGGAKLSGFICNKSPRGMVEQSVEALKAGSNLLIFPEGTRTGVGADGVGQFKAGVALIAKLSHKKILPVYLTANSRYLSKDWPIYRLPPVPLCYRATVGGLMSPEPGERARTFLKRMELGYRRQLHSVDR